ncbi:MAG TPA: secretin N-terminal domain-containing protein [Phycisphaerae bacterium]|nr:secretin N-terminal domain-containing protein [Phycisphaerae bacterium]
MRFQFDGLSYNDLIRLFAQKRSKPILGEYTVSGTLTFHDAEPYTYEEALDTINKLLAMKGFWLMEDPRCFEVMAVDKIPAKAKILQGMAELDKVRPQEVVTVVVPLQFLDATTASKAVVRMVSSWGSISPMTKGKGIVITDSAESIRRISEFLSLMDGQDIADRQIEVLPLERASAREVSEIISKLFGATQRPQYYRNPVSGRYEIDPTANAGAPVSAMPDDRTNTIILMSTSDRLAMAKAMVEQLDKAGPELGSDIRIYELKHARADDVAKVLMAAVGGTTISTSPGGGGEGYNRYNRYQQPPGGGGGPSSTPVRVVAEAATNRLIVSAPADKVPTIEKLIKELDVASENTGGARIFRLKAADAQQLVSVISSTLSVTSRDYRGMTTSSSSVRVTADPRTNSLIVAGSAADIQVAQTIIEELDKEGEVPQREIHVVHLKAGDARQVASALLSIFSQGGSSAGGASRYSRYGGAPAPSAPAAGTSIRVEADSTTNTLLIACSPGEWPTIQKILDELQASMAVLATPVTKRIPLKAAKAEDLAETLRQIYGGSTGGFGAAARFGASRFGGSRYGATATPGATGQTVPVNIVPDRNTNSLIISATEDDHMAIAELIKALDVPPTEKVDPIRLVRLENAQAAKLAETLQAMLPPSERGREQEVFVHADTLTNSLLIRAPESQRKVIEEMIATLDKETKAQARETRIIPLKFTSAGELAQMLGQLYPTATTSSASSAASRFGRFNTPRRSFTGSAGGEDPDRVIISAAPGDRALVIDAPKSKIEEIAQLVASLDTEDAPGKVVVRTYDLGPAKATEVAASLANIFTEQGIRGRMQGGSSEPQPRFEPNASTNQLLVAATTAQFVEIDKVIKTLQEATTLANETKTFKLKFAKAADLVDVLQTMLSDEASAASPFSSNRFSRFRRAPTASAAGGVRVAALELGNAIVVQGPPDKLALAEKLITSFDVPDVAADAVIARVPLTNARAEMLVETLRNMLPPAERGQEPPVTIEAEKNTNSILLRGPESERKKLEEIIAQLDQETPDLTREVRIIQLKHASATALAMMLQQLYPESGGSSAAPSFSYNRFRGRTRSGASGEVNDSVTITAAPGDKSLVVDAPKTKIDEIAKLITSLDVEDAPGTMQIRTYQLTNMKAADVADSLARLFTQSAGGGGGRFRPSAPTAGPQVPEPRFEADAVTNQLMVAATAAQFVEIDKLIEKLQAAVVLANQTKTFVLKHARAAEIAGVLETMLAESGASPSYTPRSLYSPRGRRGPTGATGQVRVAAVEATNAIVVQGPPDKLQLAETLIAGFDTPEAAGQNIIRLVPLKNAQAETLVTMLQGMLPPPERGEEQRVSVQADPLTNTVLIRAPESERKTLEEMIANLDKATPSQAREMKIIQLKHASASALADMLVQLYPSATGGGGAAASRFGRFGRFGQTRTFSPGGDDSQRVIITAAPGDKALVIDAPKDKIVEIGQMVASLDTEDAPSRVQVRTYEVASGRAAEIAAALARLFGTDRGGFRGRTASTTTPEPEPKFDADPSGKRLLVAATTAQFVEIDKLIKELKIDTEAGVQTRSFPLRHARATELAEVVETMLAETPSSDGGAGFGRFRGTRRTPSPGDTVRVAAMAESNTLVVQGSPEKLLLAEQLIKTFDVDQPGKQTVIEIVKLTNAQAPSLAEAVNAALAARGGAGASSPFARRGRTGAAEAEEGVAVTAEINSNSILVRGPADEVPEVVAMIKRLDEQGDSTTVQVRTFKLENSSATELATTVGTLFRDIVRQQGAARGRNTQPVPFSVTGDERTNTLVVHTSASNFRIVEEILKTLDEKGPSVDVQFFYLVNANAYDVAEKLDAMFADKRGAAKPVIEADDLSGTISVVGKPTDLKAIEDAIVRLDESSPIDEQPIVRIVPLTQIRASRMAEFLQRIYSQTTDAEVIVKDSTPPRAPLRDDANSPLLPSLPPEANDTGLFPPTTLPATRPAAGAPTTRPGAPATQPAAARPKQKITIAVDRNSNSLVVVANRRELENIQMFIDRLALSAQDADAEFQIIPLKVADPVSVAETIDSLFNPKVRVQQQPQQPQRGGRGGQQGQQGQPQQRQPQQAAQVPKPTVVIVPDLRTRSVVVKAKPYEFEIVEQLVKQLDQGTTQINKVKIFTLKNTDAAEVASNLLELFALASRSSGAPAGTAAQGRTGSSRAPNQRRADLIRQMIELRGEAGEEGTQVDLATTVSITANRGTNSVIVSAPKDVMELVQQIIEELDQATVMARSVKLYPLKHAEVAPTVQALKEIFSGTTGGGAAASAARTGRGRPGAVPTPGGEGSMVDVPAVITGDEAGRQVIVSATDEKHELIAKVIEQIDTAQSVGEVSVKVYRLEHAEAQSMATALSAAMGTSSRGGAGAARRGTPGGGGDVGAAGQVRISADSGSNSLVIRAAKEDHERIAQLIEEMDAPSTAKYPVRTVLLKNADADDVAVTLNTLFGQGSGAAARTIGRGRGVGGAGTARSAQGVLIEADAKARMLLIRADDETFTKIQEVVAKLDVVSAQAPVVKMYDVKNAEVATMVQALQEIFGAARGAGAAAAGRRGTRGAAGAAGGEAPIVIFGDEGARKVIVSAPEETHALIAKTVEQIDESQTAENVSVIVYRLENADATTVSTALAAALNVTAAGRAARGGAGGATAGAGQLRISSDRSSNSLVVRAAAEDHVRIAKLLTDMDSSPTAKYPVRVILLKNAEATRMAEMLRTLYEGESVGTPGPGGGRGRTAAPAARGTGGKASKSNVVVEADERAGMLLVRTDDETFAKLQAIVQMLDVPSTGEAVIKLYPVKNADIPAMASALQELFGAAARGASAAARRGRGALAAAEEAPVVILGDEGARKIIVSAPAERHEQIAKAILELDAAQIDVKVAVKVYRLEYADATTVSAALATALNASASAARARRGTTGGGAAGGGEGQFRISPDSSSNTLLVRASAEDHAEITRLLAEMDQPASAKYPVRTIMLKNADAAELAATLTTLYSSAARARTARRGGATAAGGGAEAGLIIQADASGKMLLVRCDDDTFAKIQETVAKLDVVSAQAPVIKLYPVKNADVPTLVEALQQIFDAGAGGAAGIRGRRTAVGAATAEAPVTILGDEGGRRIIVSAPEEKHALIAKTIEEMDTGQGEEGVTVKVYRLESADAASIADALLTTLSTTSAARAGRGRTGVGAVPAGSLRITADRSSNSLVVRASAEDHAKITALLAEMDTAPAEKYPIRTIALTNADAAEVANILNGLFGGGASATAGARAARGRFGSTATAATGAKGSIVIQADPSARMLLVRCDDETFAKVQEVVAKLDTAATGLAQRTLIPLQHADAASVATALSQAFASQRGARGATEDTVSVVAETNSNSLIVTADAQDLVKVKALLEKLDTDTSGARTELLVLKYARAEDLAPILTQVGSAGAGATAGGMGRARTGARGAGVTVSADAGSNALVITGPTGKVDQVMKMAVELDKASEASAVPVVKMYALKNADVQTAAAYLEQIVSGQSVGAARTRRVGSAGTEAQVVIIPDEPGKRLIVSAPADKHDTIAKVVKEFDESQTGDPVIVKVYKIENTDATSVATALTAALSGSSSAARGRTGTGAASAGGVTQQITITADRGSSSLIVRAPTSEHQRIAALIEEIDVSEVAKYPVQMVPLTIADPTAVAAVLNRVFGGTAATGTAGAGRGRGAAATGTEKVLIEADVDSRMILVRADPKTFEKIRELAAKLDIPAGKAARTLLPLTFAKAELVAASLTQAFTSQRTTRLSPDEVVSVVPDASTNSLIVTANEVNLEKVKALLAQLDVKQAGTRIEMLLLKNAKAADLAPVLTQIATTGAAARGRTATAAGGTAQGVTISAETASNALIISGPSTQVDEAMQMALQLDKAAEATISSVEIIALKNGDAPSVATIIRDLYTQQQRAATANRQSIDALAVSADERANALVVATTKDMHAKVAKWVADMELMKPARGTMRLIPLKNVEPSEVEKAIQQLFNTPGGVRGPEGIQAPRGTAGRTTGSSTTGSGRVQTSVMEQQRAVLVNASDEDFELIKQLAEALDQAAEKARHKRKLFILKSADNQRIATALTSMYQPVRGATVRPEDQVTITPLAQTNAIVVSAADEKMQEVESLIEQLDKPEVAPKLEFRIYQLKEAEPTKVLPALTQMLNQIRKLRPDETIEATADERTKSIIVTAKGTLFDQIEVIIKSLDKPPAHAKVEVLIVPLKKADATRLAQVLTDMLTPTTTGLTPEARALQEQIRLLKVRSTIKKDIPELDLTKPIKVTADPTQANQQGSNSLVITSTPENLVAMQAIVELMDTVPLAEGAKVRLMHLENADAASVMTILKDIFTQGQSLAGKDGTSVSGKAVPETVSGKALVYPLNVSADLRTNTLVLSGLEETLALAELIVKDLDRESGKIVTEVRLFPLKHASAARLVPILQAVFAEQATTTAQSAEIEGLRTQVTRLRTALKDKLPKESVYTKTRPALTVQADEATNILIVAARNDVMPLIADVLGTLDIPGAGSLGAVRIFPLANADAPAIKTLLDSLHTGPNATLIRDEDKPTIAADNRTNALVVSASEKTLEVLVALIARLDTKATIDMHEVRLVTLANAEASTLAPTMQQMMDARVQRQSALGVKDAESLRMLIAADPRSNSLIVGGGVEGYQLVKALAEQLDNAAPALGGQVQLLPLVHADSGTMATSLTNLFTQRYQAARTPDLQRQRPVILPDPRTNSLLVSANADDTKILTGLLKKLDVELIDPSVRLEVIPLKHNDAAEVAPVLQQIFQARLTAMTPTGTTPPPQGRVDVTSDALSNSLIISANKENHKLIADLLAKVDVEPAAESGVVRIVPLKNADAQRIATMLQSLIQQGLYKPGITVAAQRSPAIAAREKVAIVVDIRTNSLIVSASPENYTVLAEVIAKIDSAEDFGLLGDVCLYTLKNANAVQLAPTLQNLFNAKRQAEIDAGGSGMSLSVSVIADARTNTLLVAGSRESFSALEVMLKTLDSDKIVAATQFKIFPLKHGTATAMQPTLQQLFTQRVSRGQTTDPVTVIADSRSNMLIVGASPSDMELAESLIKQLDDSQSQTGGVVTTFTLDKADATAVAATLRTLFEAQGATAGTVNISVDERTNTLIVSAGEADLKRARELIEQLDKEQLTSVTEIRVFTLQHADATELAAVLTSTLTNKPTPLTTRSANRQTLLQFVSQTKDGKELIATALQEGLLITPDARSNSLVVVAPVRNMPLLDSLVYALDSTSPRMAEIRVFPLRNADAQRMADVLTQLFRLQTTTANAKAVSYTLVTTQPAGGSATATLGSAEQDALTVTVDIRTNSMLIGGTKRYVELAEKVIQELDSSPAQERVTKVYRLRNAQATDIQTAMRSFLDQETQNVSSTLGTDGLGSAHRLLEQEVAVVAEETSNTLLLSASPRYFDTIEAMIKELDQPPPQVLIQVLLAEVTLDQKDELGIDWNVTTKWDQDRKTVTNGTQFTVAAVGDGFSLSVAAGDLTFFLRALQTQGRLQVLSRPQILASDNQEAEINVGQRVPFITNSRVTENGSTINTIQYEPVGIILRVTPRINPDGFVRLEVNPEISSLSSSSVKIAEGTNAIIVNQRSALTTVSVQDGHTIILGGLITTKDDHREDKIPFLGDIPGLGALFRGTTDEKERSELLIILTPHVLRGVEEADSMSDKQLDRANKVRGYERKEIEDYLEKYLDAVLRQEELKNKLNDELNNGKPTTPGGGTVVPINPSFLPWELPAVPRPRDSRLRPRQENTPVAGAKVLSWNNTVRELHAAADRVGSRRTR